MRRGMLVGIPEAADDDPEAVAIALCDDVVGANE